MTRSVIPKIKWPSQTLFRLLVVLILTLTDKVISGQECEHGVLSFQKVSQVLPNVEFNTPTGVLYEEPSHAITVECLSSCRQQTNCRAFVLDYSHSKCASYGQASTSDEQLTPFPSGSYFEKICHTGIEDQVHLHHVCPFNRAWTIERSPNSLLAAFTMSQVVTSSAIECATVCLKESYCRAASYEYASGKCYLSKESKRTQPQAFRSGINGWTYIENQCTLPASLCSFDRKFNNTAGSSRRILRSLDSLVFAQNWKQCETACKNEESFLCRAYFHSGNRCLLSSDDSTTVTVNKESAAQVEAVSRSNPVTVGQLTCVSDECSTGSFVYEMVPGYRLTSAKETVKSDPLANSPIGTSLTTLALKECDASGLNCPAIQVDHSTQSLINLDRNSQGRSLELVSMEGRIFYEKMCLNPPVRCLGNSSGPKVIFTRLPGVALSEIRYFKTLADVQSRRDCQQHCLSHSSEYSNSLTVCRSALYNEITAQCKLSNSTWTLGSQNRIQDHLAGQDVKLSLRMSYLENMCETPPRPSNRVKECSFKATASQARFTYPDVLLTTKDAADCESVCRNDLTCSIFAFSPARATCQVPVKATEHLIIPDQTFQLYNLTCYPSGKPPTSSTGESNEINTSPIESSSSDGTGRNVTDRVTASTRQEETSPETETSTQATTEASSEGSTPTSLATTSEATDGTSVQPPANGEDTSPTPQDLTEPTNGTPTGTTAEISTETPTTVLPATQTSPSVASPPTATTTTTVTTASSSDATQETSQPPSPSTEPSIATQTEVSTEVSTETSTIQSTSSPTATSVSTTEGEVLTTVSVTEATSTSQSSPASENKTSTSTTTSSSTEETTATSKGPTTVEPLQPTTSGNGSSNSYCGSHDESTFERIPGFEPISPDYYFSPLCKSDSRDPGILEECSKLCSQRVHCRGFVMDYKNHLCYGLMSESPLRTLSLCIADDKDFYERICIPKSLACNRLWTFERIVDQAVSPSVMPRYTIPFITREACKCLCMQETRFVCRSVTFEKRLSVCRIYDVSRESISSLIAFMSTAPSEAFISVQQQHHHSNQNQQQQLLTFVTGLEYFENMCAPVTSPCAYMPPEAGVHPYSPIRSTDVITLFQCRHACDALTDFNCRAFAFVDLVSKGSRRNQCLLFADNSYTLKRGSLRYSRDSVLYQKHCPVMANYHFRFHDKTGLHDLLQERQRAIERTTYTFPNDQTQSTLQQRIQF